MGNFARAKVYEAKARDVQCCSRVVLVLEAQSNEYLHSICGYLYHCMTGKVNFCGGKFYFCFLGVKF